MNDQKGINQMERESKDFFFKRNPKSATYEELYTYLENKGYTLSKAENAIIKYYDPNVLRIFTNITGADIFKTHFDILDNPNTPTSINYINNGGYDTIKRNIKQPYEMRYEMELSHSAYLTKQQTIEEENKLLKEKEESKAREHKTFQITEENYTWAKIGIWSTVILASVQIGISVYDVWWKDSDHETKMIQLDSIQVEQNKQIIELLKQNKHRDSDTTTIK